jgi:hypothetical protein
MEVSGQLHDPAALPSDKQSLVHIGYETECTPEPFWTRWWREKYSPPAGNRTLEPRSSSPQPSAIPTELSPLLFSIPTSKYSDRGSECDKNSLIFLLILRTSVSHTTVCLFIGLFHDALLRHKSCTVVWQFRDTERSERSFTAVFNFVTGETVWNKIFR